MVRDLPTLRGEALGSGQGELSNVGGLHRLAVLDDAQLQQDLAASFLNFPVLAVQDHGQHDDIQSLLVNDPDLGRRVNGKVAQNSTAHFLNHGRRRLLTVCFFDGRNPRLLLLIEFRQLEERAVQQGESAAGLPRSLLLLEKKIPPKLPSPQIHVSGQLIVSYLLLIFGNLYPKT